MAFYFEGEIYIVYTPHQRRRSPGMLRVSATVVVLAMILCWARWYLGQPRAPFASVTFYRNNQGGQASTVSIGSGGIYGNPNYCDTLGYMNAMYKTNVNKLYVKNYFKVAVDITVFTKIYCTDEFVALYDCDDPKKHYGSVPITVQPRQEYYLCMKTADALSVRFVQTALPAASYPGIGLKVTFWPVVNLGADNTRSCFDEQPAGSAPKFATPCHIQTPFQRYPPFQQHAALSIGDWTASSDDRIFCMPQDASVKMVATNGIPINKQCDITQCGNIDFAGVSGLTNAYVASFKDFPICSLYINNYYSSWGLKANEVQHCQVNNQCYTQPEKVSVAIRLWKSDYNPYPGGGPSIIGCPRGGWDDPYYADGSFAEYTTTLDQLCTKGGLAIDAISDLFRWVKTGRPYGETCVWASCVGIKIYRRHRSGSSPS